MNPLRVVVIGPGRAGGSVAIAAARAGHEVVAVVPGPSGRLPAGLDAPRLPVGSVIPACDLVVVAVRDDRIADVASSLRLEAAGAVIHLSGFTSIHVFDRFAGDGVVVGSIHPLQSLLDPERGAEALRGSFAAVTTDDAGFGMLSSFARSLGLRPFPLADEDKAAHHAAAAAASNFVVAALDIASELAAATGVPFEAYATLTRSVVDNAYEVGPTAALTGPVARGDVGTVAGQLRAAAAVSDDLRARYVAMVEATARTADRWDDFADVTDAE